MAGQRGGQVGQRLVEVHTGRVDEAVGVQGQSGTDRQVDADLRVVGGGVDVQHQADERLQRARPAVRAVPQWHGVAGIGEPGLPAGEVDAKVGAAGQQGRVQVGDQPVGAGEHGARVGVGCGEGTDGGTDLAHQRGGVDVVALDVADHDGHVVGPDPDEVVEVAPDVHALGARQVAGADLQARNVRQRTGQQALLEALGEAELGVVQPGAVQGLGDQSTERGEDGAFLEIEVVRLGEGQHAGADQPSRGHQRQIGPGGHPVLGLPAARVEPLQLCTGLEVRRHGVGGRLDAGGGLGQRGAVELVDQAGRIAAMAHDAQSAPFGHQHRHGSAPESRHDLLGDHAHHVLHADGLGQRAREVEEVVQRSGTCVRGPLGRGPDGPVAVGGDDVSGDDPRGQSGRVREELEQQPPVRRPQRDEGGGLPTDHCGPVVVLVHRIPQPRQDRPRPRAQQPLDRYTQQLGGGRGDRGQPAVQIDVAHALRKPFRHRGEGGGGATLRHPGALAGPDRSARPGRVRQHLGQAIGERVEPVPFTGRHLGGMRGGPEHEDGPVRGPPRDERSSREAERVRHGHRDPRVPARHVLRAAHPYDQAAAHRFGHRYRCGDADALPRPGELPGGPQGHGQFEHLPVLRQQVEPADVRVEPGRRRPQIRAASSSPRPAGASAASRPGPGDRCHGTPITSTPFEPTSETRRPPPIVARPAPSVPSCPPGSDAIEATRSVRGEQRSRRRNLGPPASDDRLPARRTRSDHHTSTFVCEALRSGINTTTPTSAAPRP